MLNYRLLIVSICIIIGLVAYLFYWNRIIGFLLGRLIRFLFWNQEESSIWVDIGSIHFSLLGGRVLLKDIAYHSSNQTIRAVKGQISWRYWLRAPADEDDLSHARVVGEDIGRKSQKSPLSCRVHVSFQGMEWFIYNRTAAYDNIVSAMDSHLGDPSATPEARASMEGIGSLRKIFSWTSAAPDAAHLGPPISLVSSIYSRTPNVVKGWVSKLKKQLPSLDPKDLLPISIEVNKGAFIIGNDSTPTLLTAEFSRSEGTYGIVASRSKHDLYKQVVNLKFRDAIIRYIDNASHESSMSVAGERLHSNIRAQNPRPLRSFSYLAFNAFAKLWRRHKLWNSMPKKPRSTSFMPHREGGPSSWGRRRARKAIEEETPVGVDFSALEYAKEPKVVEAPLLELLYYADSVGQVPNDAGSICPGDPLDIGNGDTPPEWGVDIAICGGFIRYGPWADRQRAILQQTFFPPNFADATPFARLKPGDARVWPSLNILVELRDGVTLQIPFREASKNWQWDGEVNAPNRPRKRESASIHVRAGDNSTISYMMPMIATRRGYEPTLNIHLDTVSVTSSLNDIRLVRAESCVVRCELPSPLRWNQQRQWIFAISLRTPLIYLLRDHINMFTDLGKDWSSGPPGDYNRFIPMLYRVSVEMKNYDIKTYVNDHNIIDKPLIPDENALLSLCGASLTNSVTIPLTKYRPDSTTVSCTVEGQDIGIILTLPKWNTRSLYTKPHRSNEIGRVGRLRLDASYCYFSEIHAENIDQLKLTFLMKDVVYKACGWSIRHFMILRNNYFGSFTHFSTLYEYLEKRKLKQPLGDPVDLQYREGSSNALQVEIGLVVQSGLIVIPAGIRGYEVDHEDPTKDLNDIGTCTMMALPEVQLQLRTHDYFMEMTLNIDHIATTIHMHCPEDMKYAWAIQRKAKEMLVVDSVNVVAHRLFGPQPRTSTYFCLWEFHVGRIMGRMTALEARIFVASGKQFSFSFTDPLNAPAAEYDVPSDPDVTFIKLEVDEFNMVWHVDNAAAELSLPRGLRLDSNDVPGKSHSKVSSIRVPQASLKLLLGKEQLNEWHETMNVDLDLNVDLYSAPADWPDKARAQLEFLAAQDSHTGRVLFLYMPDQSLPHDHLASGRGLCDTNLYLPQVRIPKAPSSVAQDATIPTPPEYIPSPLPLPRHLMNHSESDGDEYVSEADRDARVAKLRPQSRTAAQDIDVDSISSGDESDTGDLTDGWHSDSDPEKKRSASSNGFPGLSRYSRYTRSYTAQALHRPSWWHKTAFRLKRAGVFSRLHLVDKLVEHTPGNSGDQFSDSFVFTTDPTISTTIIRISSNTGVSVSLMPLALPALSILLTDSHNHQLDPEIRFDGIIMDHLQSLYETEEENRNPQRTVIDACLATLQIKVHQVLNDDVEANPGAQVHEDRLSCLELLSRGIRITTATFGSKYTERHLPRLALSFNDLALGLSALDGTSLVFDVACGASNLTYLDQEATASLGDISVHISQDAPAQAISTALATAALAEEVKKALLLAPGRVSVINKHVIYHAVQIAHDKIILDPLSTIQPSYLIQTGRPHRLRTDTGFKYLVYLRGYLRYLGEKERQGLFEPNEHVSLREPPSHVDALLEGQLMQFNADAEFPFIPSRSPLATLFRSDLPFALDADNATPGFPITILILKLSQLRTTCRLDDSVCSEFLLRAVTITLGVRSAECLQPHFMSPAKSTATLSIRDKAKQAIRHIGAIVSVGDVALSINPSLMRFARTAVHVLRVHKLGPFAPKGSPSRSPSRSVSPSKDSQVVTYVDLVLTTRTVKFIAGAEKLIIEYKATTIDFASTILLRPPRSENHSWDVSMNHSLTMDELRLQACAVADLTKPNEYAVLAAFIVGGGKMNAVIKREVESNPSVRLCIGLGYIHLNVPRSAIRLYRFMEEWRADYLPSLNATIQDLLFELQDTSKSPRPDPSLGRGRPTVLSYQINTVVTSLRVSLQVMRGTWVSWEMAHIVLYSTHADSYARRAQNFGLQLGSQSLIISSKAHSSDAVPNIRLRVPLPNFTVNGRYDRGVIEGLALIETFAANIKPTHWDTLLAVQQKFGQDFNDLVSIIEKSRNGKSASANQTPSHSPFKYKVVAKMKGFRIGLESGTSLILLECHQVGGAISNDVGLKWHIELSNLSLSLAMREMILKLTHSSSREHRSAFVIIDARLEMGDRGRDKGQTLKVVVNKVHAVMQPSSIGELGDFIDHLQAEISTRKEKRAKDMAEFKEKTRNLLRSLDIVTGTSQTQSLSWIDQYIVDVALNNIGVAFPLSFSNEFGLSRTSTKDPKEKGTVRAFLFSIKSITFGSHRGESGQACMKAFSFQFVSQFRQLHERDYAGECHSSRNRLLYPEMTAQLRIERKADARQLHIAANVDGFHLDVESSIPNYVSSLIDVYRHGKDRVDRLASVPRPTSQSQDPHAETQITRDSGYEGTLTSNIFLSFTFSSGRVRMFSQSCDGSPRTRSVSITAHRVSGEDFGEYEAEIFNLPVVSVWGEYRAAPASRKLSAGRVQPEPSTLIFKSTVHSSQNTLRPTLLPFLAEMMKNIEDRMRQTSKLDRSLAISSPRVLTSALQNDDAANRLGESVSSMQISLSLRIDQSKLELTCQPDVNVVAGLNWDSGGFVVNISPGAHRVTFSGSVGGLTAGLKHGFLSEDCMRLHARNLAFTVDFAKTRGSAVSSVTVVCDTEFAGGVRFSRLQDILCFKAVWLDRIPTISAAPVTPSGLGSRTTSTMTVASTAAKQELTTALLFRLREVRLDIDLGQSITSIQLSLHDAIIRTKMGEAVSEVSLSVHEVSAVATGNLSGRIAVPNFLFQTIRKERGSSVHSTQLLDLRMTSGALDIDLESEYQKIIFYRAEPLDVRIYDDWSKFTSLTATSDRRVNLAFTVKGTGVTAIMNVGTVPNLVSYGKKFQANLDAQREGASRESHAFRLSSSPKPENPLSEVANAMFLSARSKFMEDPEFNCIIGQRLSLRLKTLRLVIFPRNMHDQELAQFVGSDVHARLDRVVESDALPPTRDLQLSFATISVSKVTQLNYALATKEPSSDCLEWLTRLTRNAAEATIFSLPSMDMRMHSEETTEDGVRVLPYDFSSKFSDIQGVKEEDIYITLNMALYSWLTLLRKTFAREMEQVQASADVRPTGSGLAQTTRRSKPPDSLPLRQEKDLELPRPGAESSETVSPQSRGRVPLLQHTKSTPARYMTMSPSPSDWAASPASQSPASAASGARFPTASPIEENLNVSRSSSPGLSTQKAAGLTYRARMRHIERLTLRQLGEATPDVMHPFFMKTAGFSLEDSLPQYVHEYATMPTEEIMKALLKLYSKQLKVDNIPLAK